MLINSDPQIKPPSFQIVAKPVLRAQVLNDYRSHRPIGFYNPIKGHTGVDLNYRYENFPSPVTGRVLKIIHQLEMGNCIYIEDALGSIHVFAHFDSFVKKMGDQVLRNEIIGKTGMTGSRATAPHTHWEIITPKWVNTIDRIMGRELEGFKGYNTHPIIYLKVLYFKYHINIDGNVITSI